MRVAQELLSNYQHVISELKLVTGSKGVFDIDVDGTRIYSKQQSGGFPSEGEALTEFERLLPTGTERYGD